MGGVEQGSGWCFRDHKGKIVHGLTITLGGMAQIKAMAEVERRVEVALSE